MRRWKTLALMVLLALLPARAGLPEDDKKKDPEQIGNRDVSKGINLYSLENEIALGRRLAEEVQRQSRMVEEPLIAEYVNRIGQNLVRNSDAKVPFTIRVIDNEEVNAFALPGGFLFVNSGLILKTESEAELAGVMAHEIAHVAARHGTRQASRAELAQLLSVPLIFVGGWPGYGGQQAANLLVPLVFVQFSRAFEAEADLLGLQYTYKAGYDPTAVLDFFERLQNLQKRKPGAVAKVLSTHPMAQDRIRASQTNIRERLKARPEYVVNTSEFEAVKTHLMALSTWRKLDNEDLNRPRLRKRPGQQHVTNWTQPADTPARSTL